MRKAVFDLYKSKVPNELESDNAADYFLKRTGVREYYVADVPIGKYLSRYGRVGIGGWEEGEVLVCCVD